MLTRPIRSSLIALMLAGCAGTPSERVDAQALPAPAADTGIIWDAPLPPKTPPEAAAEEAPAPAAVAPTLSAPVEAAPVSAPAPAPAPEPVSAPPAPTEANPLLVDCTPDTAEACRQKLSAAHPDWVANAAAHCVYRICTEASECADLGAGLVCRANDGTPPICRLPRGALNSRCTQDRQMTECEPGLWCRPFLQNSFLTCQPFDCSTGAC